MNVGGCIAGGTAVLIEARRRSSRRAGHAARHLRDRVAAGWLRAPRSSGVERLSCGARETGHGAVRRRGSVRAALRARGLPTVAVEALACEMRQIVSADNPGGVELHGVFGEDIRVVQKRIGALACAVRRRSPDRRRASGTGAIQQRFRAEAVARNVDGVRGGRLRRSIMKAAGRAIAAAVLAGLFGAAVALFCAWHPAVVVGRSRPAAASSVHPPERDRASGLTFAWT